MVARLFDDWQIKKGGTDRNLLKWFLSDFPYRAEDFKGVKTELPDDSESVLKNFRMLSLLMVKEETSEVAALKELYKNAVPFGECSSFVFSELDMERWSALFFPLRTKDDELPSWGLAVKSDKGKTFFFNAYTEKWSAFWDYKKDGPSCRLAETLAEKLVQEGTPDQIYAAAKEWIVTGDAGKTGKVGKVGLGNKLELTTKRKFIVPDANYAGISRGTFGKTIRFADTVEAAWNHITDQGTKHLENMEFSGKVDELHVLVGGNIKAQVASIILLKPEKVFLWHSESEKESKIPAEWIKYVAEKYAGITPEINFLTSKKIYEAEKALKDHFENISPDKTVVFNVTSGNRLMSYAAQTTANTYRNVELIYRDIDETENQERKYYFTRLLYNEFPPFSGRIWVKLDDKINDDFLCGKDKYNDGEDFYKQLTMRGK